jgi:hypothetical protein
VEVGDNYVMNRSGICNCHEANHKIKEDEMTGICSTHRRMRNAYKYFSLKTNGEETIWEACGKVGQQLLNEY